MSDFQPYPVVSARINCYGHLELYKGRLAIGEVMSRESDVYMQVDSDVRAVLESLPVDEAESISDGYTVATHFISDEYFA